MASACISLTGHQAAGSNQPGGRGPEGRAGAGTRTSVGLQFLGPRGARKPGSPDTVLDFASCPCYLRALPVSLSVPRALLCRASATKGLLDCPLRVVPPARNGPQIKVRRGPLKPDSFTSSWDPAPPSLLTHLGHRGTVVGAVASSGFWDLSEVKEMGKGTVTKDPNTLLEQGHQLSQDQEAVGPSLGPVGGFQAPTQNPGLVGRRAGSLLTLPFLAQRQARRSSTSLPVCKARDQGSAELCSVSGQG